MSIIRAILIALGAALLLWAIFGGVYYGMWLDDVRRMYACGLALPFAILAFAIADKLNGSRG